MTPVRPNLSNRVRRWARLDSRFDVGLALGLFATVGLSFAPPVARFAILGGFNSTTLLLMRMLLATTLFAIALAVTDRQKLRMPRTGAAAAAVVGAVNAAGMIFFFAALSLLEASLGERLTRRHLVRLGLALAGVYLLIGPTGQVDWLGAALALTATFLFSLQTALTQWTLVAYPTRSVAFYVTAAMTIFVTAYWLWLGAPWSAPSASAPWISTPSPPSRP